MPQTVDQFAKSLIAAGLATADEIKALWGTIPAGQRPKDGETFSKLLIARDKLTDFQAEELLSGSQTPLVLGDYVLLSKIGAGGMGQVFKAQHRVMERLVAIKLLPPALVKDEDAVKRFQREVKAAAKLSHPNIVAALDARKERGVWCLVMEYVEGRDLAHVVAQEGPLPIARAIDYIRQAARGLAFAHESGVVHRDIKPANLLLDKKGAVKILDMGLARIDDAAVAAAQEGLTQSGQVMGTIDYMAPEQAFNTKTADARADIYSLGCTLWRLLTGKNLFDGDTVVQKLMAHQTIPVPSLAAVRPDASAALQKIFERMVAKQPQDRFPTMTEVEAALAVLDGSAPSGAAQVKPEVDSQLNAFFQSLPGKKPAATPTKSATAAPPDGHSATISLTHPQVTTDPVSERAIHSAREATRRPPGARPKDKLPLYLGGGLTGVLVVCVAIWLVVRGRNGGEVAPPKKSAASVATSSGKSAPGKATGSTPVGPPPPLAVAPFKEAEAKQHQQAWAKYLGQSVEKEIALPGGEKLVMMLIPAGEFMRSEDSKSSFRVRLTKPFYLGKYEVTQAQWQAVMGSNPSQFKDNPTHPVEKVSWDDIQLFLAKLNSSGSAGPRRFALPTEAQWEYACRAGTTTAFSFGDSAADLAQFAWFKDNSGNKTHSVGQLKPNRFGLYDMHGNVWEWCADWKADGYYGKAPQEDPPGPSEGSFRVFRGGGWDFGAALCRAAYRLAYGPSSRGDSYGFRLALSSFGASPEAGQAKPNSTTTSTAKPEVAAKPTGSQPPVAVAPLKESEVQQKQRDCANELGIPVEREIALPAGEKLTMLLIPPGEFMRSEDSKSSYRVRLTKPFYLGKYEVTQAQWQAVMGSNPSQFKDNPTHPVEKVSWDDIQLFLAKLNSSGSAGPRRFALPTEAQWEYACRAGTTTTFSFGDSAADLAQFAWFKDNSGNKTHSVGQLKPNRFGLYDMHGNVWEWCADWKADGYYANASQEDPPGPSEGSFRVIRGGCWDGDAAGCRAAYRSANVPTIRWDSFGFRLALTPSGVSFRQE